MTTYSPRQTGSSRQQILAALVIGLVLIAMLTFLSVATSMSGIAMEPTPVPAPGIP